MGKEMLAIEANDLTIGYALKGGRRKVVHEGLHLSLYLGEVTCLLGLNGAGKSTLLRTLCGFQPALAGEVRILGKSLEAYSRAEFSTTVGVVLTEKTNAGGISVRELVALGRHPYTDFLGRLQDEDKRIVQQSMESVGIVHKADSYVSELSDGERQKAMIARTLAQQCPVILLDEPTAFLDVTSRLETMTLLHRLAVEQHKAILLSTHDLELAIQMGDRLWLLAQGRPMASGMPEELILSGAFSSFFERGDVRFDVRTGQLSMAAPQSPVGVRGDALTAYWLRNALLRNGFNPSPFSIDYPSIDCLSPQSFQLYLSGNVQETTSLPELLSLLMNR